MAQQHTPAPEDLPAEAGAADKPPVLSGGELGPSGFVGRVIKLEGVELRLIQHDKIRCYAKLGELVRHEGKPRVREVLIALFDERKLQMTIESPYAEGDPAEFLSKKSPARIVSFGGGVILRDPKGRERGRVDRLQLDLDHLTLRSSDRVSMRLVDDDIELTADGLFADLSKDRRTVQVGGNVTLTAPTGGGTATLRCKGPGTVLELGKDEYRLTLIDDAVIEHPLATATCDRIVALVKQAGKRAELLRTTLTGGVDIDIQAKESGGLRSVKAPEVVIDGEQQVRLRSFSAVRDGVVPALGPESRTIELKADAAALTLVRENDRSLKVWDVSLKGGVEARDRNGPSYMLAGSVLFNEATGSFFASGGVEAKTPDGFVRSRSLRTENVKDREYDLVLEGPGKRVEYTVDGKLGPLGKGRRGRLVATCDGPLRAEVREKSTLLRATESVRVELAGDAHLECGRLTLFVYERDLRWMEARGKVHLAEGGRGAELRGDALLYRDKYALLRGTPARVQSEELGTLRARTIAYRDGGEFVAKDAVALHARLDRGDHVERWRIYCNEARGLLREKDTPEFVEALGTVIAMGPENQHFTGNYFRFDGKPGEAILRGDPAIVQRGKDLRLEALQVDLRIKDEKLASASTPWPAVVHLHPKAQEAGGLRFARWTLRLKSGARFSGDKLLAPKGGSFIAYDEKGVKQVSGRVGSATVLLQRLKGRWNPTRLLCRRRIDATMHGKDRAKVTADTMSFLVGKREVDLRGNARVQAKGWSPEATFEHLVFRLAKDGVDLVRASDIAVRDPRR